VLGWIVVLEMLRGGITPTQAAPFAYIPLTIDQDFECTLLIESAVAIMDTATNAVVATVPVAPCPSSVAVHPAGTFVYVATAYDVAVIATATTTVVATVPLGGLPGEVAVHPAGTFVYVTGYLFVPGGPSGTVFVIATSTNTVVATVPVGILPEGVAVHPAGTFVYVANKSSCTISVLDTATTTVVATVPLGNCDTSAGPQGVAVHPAGTFVYVTNVHNKNVNVLDTTTNTVVAIVPLARFPFGVAVHPAGTFLYVTGGDTVFVIDTSTNTVVATVPLGGGPFGVAVHPAGTFVYVMGGDTGGDTVSVIDTSTNTVVATVPLGHPATAFGEFVGPELPGVSLTLNQGTFHRGETLSLGATTYAGDAPRAVDAYVEVGLPDGSLLFMQPDGSFTGEMRPVVTNWPVAPFSGEIVRHTFDGSEPSGPYRWRARFTDPGTLHLIGLTAQAPFTFSP
jgi:YVTN family beta-propeller protein